MKLWHKHEWSEWRVYFKDGTRYMHHHCIRCGLAETLWSYSQGQ